MSADYRNWYLFNASPDIRAQIDAFPGLHPGPERSTPIRGVVLTDAEIDHTLGLLLLREGRGVELHATTTVHQNLREGTSFLDTLERFCPVQWHTVVPGADAALGEGLSYRAFEAPTTKDARFGADGQPSQVVGYRIRDEASGHVVVYLPGVQALTPEIREQFEGCDCLLIDGTCWADDELIQLGLANKTAYDMGHISVGGPTGSLEQLASLPIERKIYIHINNSNPILLDDSPERAAVAERGVDVAVDGLEVEV